MKSKIKFDFQIDTKNPSLREGTAISNLDGRLWDEIGNNVGKYFGDEALVRSRIAVESYYLISLSEIGIIRRFTQKEIFILKNIYKSIDEKLYKRIRNTENSVKHDIVAMSLIFKNVLKKYNVLSDIAENWVHWSLTSEDIDNIARTILIKNYIKNVYIPHYKAFIELLLKKTHEFNGVVIPGKTHLQTATPTLLSKELSVFLNRFSDSFLKISKFKYSAKLMGATGNLSAHKYSYPNINWIKFSNDFIKSFDLVPNIFTTQVEPKSNLVELLSLINLVNSIIIDFSQDLRIMIGFVWLKQSVNNKETGSSTMPQKVNPIDFENSQGNALMANWVLEGLSRQLPISWLQRDLVDKTIQRNFGLPFGHSTIALISMKKGLEKLTTDKEKIELDLNSDWTIISEAVQTYLKSKNVSNAYEIIKNKTRGKKIGKQEFIKIIKSLDVSKDIMSKLIDIEPKKYIGEGESIVNIAVKKTKKILK
jgi:adenylosuccinate lyase